MGIGSLVVPKFFKGKEYRKPRFEASRIVELIPACEMTMGKPGAKMERCNGTVWYEHLHFLKEVK